jgi:hypothetical protein
VAGLIVPNQAQLFDPEDCLPAGAAVVAGIVRRQLTGPAGRTKD